MASIGSASVVSDILRNLNYLFSSPWIRGKEIYLDDLRNAYATAFGVSLDEQCAFANATAEYLLQHFFSEQFTLRYPLLTDSSSNLSATIVPNPRAPLPIQGFLVRPPANGNRGSQANTSFIGNPGYTALSALEMKEVLEKVKQKLVEILLKDNSKEVSLVMLLKTIKKHFYPNLFKRLDDFEQFLAQELKDSVVIEGSVVRHCNSNLRIRELNDDEKLNEEPSTQSIDSSPIKTEGTSSGIRRQPLGIDSCSTDTSVFSFHTKDNFGGFHVSEVMPTREISDPCTCSTLVKSASFSNNEKKTVLTHWDLKPIDDSMNQFVSDRATLHDSTVSTFEDGYVFTSVDPEPMHFPHANFTEECEKWRGQIERFPLLTLLLKQFEGQLESSNKCFTPEEFEVFAKNRLANTFGISDICDLYECDIVISRGKLFALHQLIKEMDFFVFSWNGWVLFDFLRKKGPTLYNNLPDSLEFSNNEKKGKEVLVWEVLGHPEMSKAFVIEFLSSDDRYQMWIRNNRNLDVRNVVVPLKDQAESLGWTKFPK